MTGGTSWQRENYKEYTQNTSGIVVKVRDEAGNITEYNEVLNIALIDKTGPNIEMNITRKSTKEITTTVSSEDLGVGIFEPVTYTYYLKKATDSDYQKIHETSAKTYTYINLKSNTEYNLKVEASDILGNIGEKVITTQTNNLNYEIGNIEVTSIVWSNSIATIGVVNHREDFPMEYQIAENAETLNQEGTWIKSDIQNIEIANLKDGSIVYARLTDEVNSSTLYATFNISSGATKKYTEESLARDTTRESFEIYGISASDNEIRVQIEGEQENASLYNYYYKNINDEEYTLISTSTYYYDPAVIKDIKPGNTYKIKATVIDKNGRVTRSENSATMIATNLAERNQSYTENRTYLDNSKTLVSSKTAGTGKVIPDNTQEITAGYTISLPGTFKITNDVTQNKGITIQDSNLNEFVWIPVSDAVYDGVTELPTSAANASITYKPMAERWAEEPAFYDSIVYYFNGINSWKDSDKTGQGKARYKEPCILTNHVGDNYTWRVKETVGKVYDADVANYKTFLGFESTEEMGIYLANSFNSMITSVDSYGGFLIGRYEATGTSDNITVRDYSNVYTGINWYTMFKQLDSARYEKNPYYNTVSVVSSMIWGAQWDATLNFLLKGDKDNYISTKKLGVSKLELDKSATDGDDLISNIYDLGSNAYEWTLQANNTNYRVARGGGYNIIYADKMSTKKDFYPTESGPALGTRMALYLQSTNDTTGPNLEIKNIEYNSNSVQIKTKGVDRETGVKKYEYFLSEDGINYELKSSGVFANYTYTNLKQDTKYYLKIQAIDGAGNISEPILEEITTKKLGKVAKDNISIVQRLGTNENGTIILQATSEYTDTGYYIEYQIVENEQAINQNNWIRENTINGVKTGETIFACLYDGINRSEDFFIYEIEDLEQFRYIDSEGNTYTEEEAKLPSNANKTSYDKTIKYTDEEGAEAYIPAGFKVGITELVNNINNGLVIQDKDENQFVWVPVPDAIYKAGKTIPVNVNQAKTDKIFYRPMAKHQSGENSRYYESVIYNFVENTGNPYSYLYRAIATANIGLGGFREPSLITNLADYTWNVTSENKIGTAYDVDIAYYQRLGFHVNANVNAFKDYTEFGHYMNQEYTNMIESVDRYKGFYVARFETSTETELTTSNRAQDVNTVVETKRDKTPISNQMWYKLYYYQDSNLNQNNPYYGSNSVTCSMIWGAQWDAIMNWYLKDEETKGFVMAKKGNHEDRVALTGEFIDDFAKNIFDLSGNMIERTQEANSSYIRQQRGGSANTSGDYHYYETAHRLGSWGYPTYSYTISNINGGIGSYNKSKYYNGSRMSLYIKNQEITEQDKPQIEVLNVRAETNNIKIDLYGKDTKAGIGKYKFTLYDENEVKLDEIETYKFTHTFYKLSQNTQYIIKASVKNLQGIESDIITVDLNKTKTIKLNLTNADITLEKTWGKSGDRKSIF